MSDPKPKNVEAYLQERVSTRVDGQKLYTYRRKVPKDLRDSIDPPRRVYEWTTAFGAVPKHVAMGRARDLAALHDATIRRLRDGESPIDANAAAIAETQAKQLLADGRAATNEALNGFLAEAFERWLGERAKFGANHRAWRQSEPDGESFFRMKFAGEEFSPVSAPPEFEDIDPVELGAFPKAVVEGLDSGGRVMPKRVSLSDAYASDKAHYVDPQAPRDERPYKAAVTSFITSQGDLDIRHITLEQVRGWIAWCRAPGRQHANNTIRRRAECLSAIHKRWHKERGVPSVNPFAELGLSSGKKAALKLPFAKVHLDAIDAWIEKAKESKRGVTRTHRIWTVLKCTGARPAEIAGLCPGDVYLDDAIPHIWIRKNAMRRLKNDGSERLVPLVGAALETMRDAMRSPAGVGVFYADPVKEQNLSDALNMGLRRVGIASSGRLSAGSFRHGMKQALRQSGCREDVARYLQGHAGGAVADNYGSHIPLLTELRNALEAAIPQLGNVNTRMFDRPGELQIVPEKTKAKARAVSDEKRPNEGAKMR